MEFIAADLDSRARYKLMIGTIQPRPIAWVSSISENGKPNLAPFSFFTAICPEPPLVVFCPNIRRTDEQEKDTLQNIRATKEFVINIVTASNAEAMNITATELPSDVNEFERANLTTVASKLVKPPSVAESPIHFECKLHQIVEIGNKPGQGSMVIGEIILFHVDDSVYVPDHKIDSRLLKPVGRMSGMDYVHTDHIFELIRPPSEL